MSFERLATFFSTYRKCDMVFFYSLNSGSCDICENVRLTQETTSLHELPRSAQQFPVKKKCEVFWSVKLYHLLSIVHWFDAWKSPKYIKQGVTKRCRLSWLTNSALVYEPKCGGKGGGLRVLSQWWQLCTWSSNKLRRSSSIFILYILCTGDQHYIP